METSNETVYIISNFPCSIFNTTQLLLTSVKNSISFNKVANEIVPLDNLGRINGNLLFRVAVKSGKSEIHVLST